MSGYVYEVHVSAQHWAEGCDYHGMGVESATQCCPVFRAAVEAGLQVDSVYASGWYDAWGQYRHFPEAACAAIGAFDDFRQGDRATLPEPLTFYVDLKA